MKNKLIAVLTGLLAMWVALAHAQPEAMVPSPALVHERSVPERMMRDVSSQAELEPALAAYIHAGDIVRYRLAPDSSYRFVGIEYSSAPEFSPNARQWFEPVAIAGNAMMMSVRARDDAPELRAKTILLTREVATGEVVRVDPLIVIGPPM